MPVWFFLIHHRRTHNVCFPLPSRVQSVFWGPTSTSSRPAGSWRQIWSSHSLCRQALLTFHCEFWRQSVTCSTGRIVLQPFRTEQPPARSVRNMCTSFTHKCVYSVLYRLNPTEAIIFSLSSWSEAFASVVIGCGGQEGLPCLSTAVFQVQLSLVQKWLTSAFMEAKIFFLWQAQCYRVGVIDPACILSAFGWVILKCFLDYLSIQSKWWEQRLGPLSCTSLDKLVVFVFQSNRTEIDI